MNVFKKKMRVVFTQAREAGRKQPESANDHLQEMNSNYVSSAALLVSGKSRQNFDL